jgi:hypothetical protein
MSATSKVKLTSSFGFEERASKPEANPGSKCHRLFELRTQRSVSSRKGRERGDNVVELVIKPQTIGGIVRKYGDDADERDLVLAAHVGHFDRLLCEYSLGLAFLTTLRTSHLVPAPRG